MRERNQLTFIYINFRLSALLSARTNLSALLFGCDEIFFFFVFEIRREPNIHNTRFSCAFNMRSTSFSAPRVAKKKQLLHLARCPPTQSVSIYWILIKTFFFFNFLIDNEKILIYFCTLTTTNITSITNYICIVACI